MAHRRSAQPQGAHKPFPVTVPAHDGPEELDLPANEDLIDDARGHGEDTHPHLLA